jgi:hypothetical protein
MAADPNAVEQVVSRTLRDNLERIQRTADELHQAVNDMVSACASSRPSNALPSMVRAQTSAAALSSTLEVLSRFVTSALQPAMRMPFEPDILRVPSMIAPPVGFEQPPPPPSHPIDEISWAAPPPVVPPPPVSEIPPPVEQKPAAPEIYSSVETAAIAQEPPSAETSAPVEATASTEAMTETPSRNVSEPESAHVHEPMPSGFEQGLPPEDYLDVEARNAVEPGEAPPAFSLDLLPPEEQELHRRAFRVAKVSMQDIKMLRPEDIRLGRENKDLCFRLRDDIEKAHKEYDRRFQSIQGHPVDYFYDWMVEILAGGDPQALGEYPYPSPVLRR